MSKERDYDPAKIHTFPGTGNRGEAGASVPRSNCCYTLEVYGKHPRAEITRIVTAVNAHDELVAALRLARSRIAHDNMGTDHVLHVLFGIIDAALAAAKEDTHER